MRAFFISEKLERKMNKRAQVTLFIIIAILIVAGVLIFNYVSKLPVALPSEIKSVEDYFTGCISARAQDGLSVLGEQAGYIEQPETDPSSEYAPFSNKFNFLGIEVPYWFYVSGNNLQKEQIPTIENMQKELETYVSDTFLDCADFSSFEDQGYNITKSDNVTIKSKINDNSVIISLNYPITVSFNGVSRRIQLHSVQITSDYGKLFKESRKIYDSEQQQLFFENYSVDVIAMYVPTNNFEISCVPKIWDVENVSSTIKNALQQNFITLKAKGTYYTLGNDVRKYFVFNTGQNFDDAVSVKYNPSWPTTFEVYPSQNGVMRADPVGTQAGLNVLGFCYINYNFVYSMKFPVLVQVISNKTGELFQFPYVVIIEKNKPKNATVPEQVATSLPEICNARVQNATVYTYDSEGNPVEADISFKCLNTICSIGKTSISENEAVLSDLFPQCVNGFIVAQAPGFSETKYQISSNQEFIAAVLMQKLYNLSLSFDQQAQNKILISARSLSGEYSTISVWPDQKTIQLEPGDYEFSITVFNQGNISIPAQQTEQCVNVPADGVAGVFGITKQQCFPLNSSAMTLSEVPVGGGKVNVTIYEEELRNSKNILFHINSFSIPKNINDLQQVYNLIQNSELNPPDLS